MPRRQRRGRGRTVDGILVLDKPEGLTSNDALQQVKRLFNAAKAGHTGSLDPLATGVLPLCFGEATKLSQFLLGSDKRYWARLKLGVTTASGDADGEVLEERSIAGVDRAAVEAAVAAFQGDLQQVPSMFSALKHEGQPLYKLARQGIEVERQARPITIHEHILHAFEGDLIEIEVACSKGTYIRTIAEDMGELLGCGAHVVALKRLQAGPFKLAEAVTLGALEALRDAGDFPAMAAYLLPLDSAVRDWPVVVLDELPGFYLKQGQPVLVPKAPTSGWVRLMQGDEAGETKFIGVGEVLDDGRIAPRRLLAGGGRR